MDNSKPLQIIKINYRFSNDYTPLTFNRANINDYFIGRSEIHLTVKKQAYIKLNEEKTYIWNLNLHKEKILELFEFEKFLRNEKIDTKINTEDEYPF